MTRPSIHNPYGKSRHQVTSLGKFVNQNLDAIRNPDILYGGLEGDPLCLAPADIEEVVELNRGIVTNLRAHDRALSEVNTQRLPWAWLWDRDTGTSRPIEVVETYLRDGKTIQRLWRVTPGSDFGMPGPTAYETFRALESLILPRTIGRSIQLSSDRAYPLRFGVASTTT